MNVSSSLFIDNSTTSYSTECVQIKTHKIIEFYNSNPSISFEKINLLVLEMLQHKIISMSDAGLSDFLRPEEKHKTDEMLGFLNNIREAVHLQIQYVLQESAQIKTEYIC